MQPSSTTMVLDSLRLNDRQAQAILQQMNQAAQDSSAEVRENRRIATEGNATVVVELLGFGNSPTAFLVRPRNISTGGIGFIHGAFVYNGTPCAVTMRALDGRTVRLLGKTVRCRHIAGRVHEVGVALEQPIVLSEFVSPNGVSDSQDAPAAPSRVTLFLSPSTEDVPLLAFCLEPIGVAVVGAIIEKQAADQVRDGAFDLLIIEPRPGAATTADFIAGLRTGGYAGPILGAFEGKDSKSAAKFREHGFDAAMPKPFTLVQFVTAVAAAIQPMPGVKNAPAHQPKLHAATTAMLQSFRKPLEKILVKLRANDKK
jgi:hypothetical protein